jgi:2-methylaconitate cis-trans-isomerase PrpF
MGLIKDLSEAATRQHTPKVAFVAPPKSTCIQRQAVAAGDIDLLVRAVDGQAAPRHDGHGCGGHRHGRRFPARW